MPNNDELWTEADRQRAANGGSWQLKSATDQSDRVNSVYDANAAARQKELEAAWNQKNMDFDRADQKITPMYDTQRNDLESAYQIARHNMGERAAANGINSGTGTQIALSQNNQYMKNYGAIGKAEAQAHSDLEFERAKAAAQYRDAVAQALADNDVERAKALYEEAVRVDNSLVATAQAQAQMDLQREAADWSRRKDEAETLAKFGDFSGYAALGYTAEQIAQMRAQWLLEHPQAGGGYGYGGGYRRGGSGSGSGTPTTSAAEQAIAIARSAPIVGNVKKGGNSKGGNWWTDPNTGVKYWNDSY